MLSRRLLRIKVVKALYSHLQSDSDSLVASLNNLTSSVDKTYDLYHHILWLIVEVMRFAEARIELNRKKKLPTKEDLNPNTKFIDNQLIRQIESSDQLIEYLKKGKLTWSNHPDLIRSIYNSMVESEAYQNYLSSGDSSFNEDARFVEDFYLEFVEDNEQVVEVLEEQSIFWSDDLDYALILAIKTIRSSRKGKSDLDIAQKFKSDDDVAFYKELFTKAIVNNSLYLEYIEKFTQNWDVERIAFMDNVIMVVAVAELINFNDIPIKVTLNEYIEISKYYSTPNSSHFINGVLDRVTKMLEEEGKIEKEGRGLL